MNAVSMDYRSKRVQARLTQHFEGQPGGFFIRGLLVEAACRAVRLLVNLFHEEISNSLGD